MNCYFCKSSYLFRNAFILTTAHNTTNKDTGVENWTENQRTENIYKELVLVACFFGYDLVVLGGVKNAIFDTFNHVWRILSINQS